jgi:hypothetical protein
VSRFKAAAYSIDGRTFAFSGPVMTGIRPGSYAAIETPGGEQHLGQILDLHPEPGATFAEPTVRGTGRLLSESADDPFMNATLSVAEPALVRSRLPADGDEGAVQIGALADVVGVPAVPRARASGDTHSCAGSLALERPTRWAWCWSVSCTTRRCGSSSLTRSPTTSGSVSWLLRPPLKGAYRHYDMEPPPEDRRAAPRARRQAR